MSIKSKILFPFLLFPLLYSAQIELMDSIQIKEAVVIAAPAKIEVKEYPRSVSIITSKEIIQSGPQHLQQLTEN